MLVIPALFFLFLKNFGQNHFSLPRYYPLIDSTSGEVRVEKKLMDGKTFTDTAFHQIPGFRLTNQANQQVTAQVIDGKIHVADFFFARCPGICPKMSSQLSRVQDVFRDNSNVVIVSYTVDPEHDTPEELAKYAQQYGAIPGKWHLLTGDKAEIYTLAKKGYFVTAKEDQPQSENLEDQFVHTDKFVLVDQKRRIRGYYNGTDPEDVDRLLVEIKILLYENDQQ